MAHYCCPRPADVAAYAAEKRAAQRWGWSSWPSMYRPDPTPAERRLWLDQTGVRPNVATDFSAAETAAMAQEAGVELCDFVQVARARAVEAARAAAPLARIAELSLPEVLA
eukprot:SAG22_NODE_10943_length_508_cov_2.134474_1_plen_110_part_10